MSSGGGLMPTGLGRPVALGDLPGLLGWGVSGGGEWLLYVEEASFC